MLSKQLVKKALNEFLELVEGTSFHADTLAAHIVHRCFHEMQNNPDAQSTTGPNLLAAMEVLGSALHGEDEIVIRKAPNNTFWAELWHDGKEQANRAYNNYDTFPVADSLIQLARKVAKDV